MVDWSMSRSTDVTAWLSKECIFLLLMFRRSEEFGRKVIPTRRPSQLQFSFHFVQYQLSLATTFRGPTTWRINGGASRRQLNLRVYLAMKFIKEDHWKNTSMEDRLSAVFRRHGRVSFSANTFQALRVICISVQAISIAMSWKMISAMDNNN